MQEEFELTYLARTLPVGFSTSGESREILDIYIPKSSEHAVLRIRKQGEKYEITKKTIFSGTDSSHMQENTIPLSQEEFAELAQIEGKRVRKIRYYYTENGTGFEIDVFQDALEGLVLVDVEFSSNEEKSAFVQPDWLLVEVTQEKAFAGGVLCGKSYAEIEEELSEYSYKPIIL